MAVSGIDLGKYKLGWSDSTDDYVYAPKKGLNEGVVRDISGQKDEPEWMTKFRLNALKRFERQPMLEWFAANMCDLDFDDIGSPQTCPTSPSTTSTTTSSPRTSRSRSGTTSPRACRRPTRSWASPRPSAS